MERLLELTKQHKEIMDSKGIVICVYPNASGFLWSVSKANSGTDLGWSEFNGNDENSGTFKKYEDAFEDAITLINKCDLDRFRKETNNAHWGLYADHLNKYRL